MALFGLTGALVFVGVAVLAIAGLLVARPLSAAPAPELALAPSL